jgi:hypothetical protein
MPLHKPIDVDDYLKRFERHLRTREDALTSAVQREFHVRPVWDPMAQDWYFLKPGGKPLQAPRPARRRHVPPR